MTHRLFVAALSAAALPALLAAAPYAGSWRAVVRFEGAVGYSGKTSVTRSFRVRFEGAVGYSGKTSVTRSFRVR